MRVGACIRDSNFHGYQNFGRWCVQNAKIKWLLLCRGFKPLHKSIIGSGFNKLLHQKLYASVYATVI